MAINKATATKLPAEFADLEPYLEWDLATEPERYAKRLASSMRRRSKATITAWSCRRTAG